MGLAFFSGDRQRANPMYHPRLLIVSRNSTVIFLFQPQVRAAALSCLNSLFEEMGLVPLIESEVISGALATDNPNMRAEVKFVDLCSLQK